MRRAIVVPVSTLPDHREAILDAMVGHYGGDPAQHARALMSQWSKYYFGRAAPAGVVAALTLGRPLDMSPERTFVALDDGMPAALYFPHDALGAPCDDPAPRYAAVAHLGAVIDLLAAMGRVTPRVLWSNAGNLLDYLLDTCRSLPCAADPVRDADWLFVELRARRAESAACARARCRAALGAAADAVSCAPRVLPAL